MLAKTSTPSSPFLNGQSASSRARFRGAEAMSSKITRDILEGYLYCQFKGHLKSTGETGVESDFEAMLAQTRTAVAGRAMDSIRAHNPPPRCEQDLTVSRATLKGGASFFFNAILEDEGHSLCCDGL